MRTTVFPEGEKKRLNFDAFNEQPDITPGFMPKNQEPSFAEQMVKLRLEQLDAQRRGIAIPSAKTVIRIKRPPIQTMNTITMATTTITSTSTAPQSATKTTTTVVQNAESKTPFNERKKQTTKETTVTTSSPQLVSSI